MAIPLNTGHRGRPQKDYSCEIGRTYQRARITAIVPGLRAGTGVKVVAECLDCKQTFTARLSYLKSGKTKTCGCLKKANYRKWLGELVARMSPEAIAGCWGDRFRGVERKVAAKLRKVARATFDEAVRTYQEILDTMLEDGTAIQIFRTVQLPGSDMLKVGAKFGLGAEAVQYLVKSIAYKLGLKADHEYGIAAHCAMVTDEVEDRKDWTIARPGEFSRDELRRSKGRIIGRLARLYRDAELLLAGSLQPNHRRDMMAFIELANDTLASRLARQKAHARRAIVERERERAITTMTVNAVDNPQ
jgi:hypothetical protein